MKGKVLKILSLIAVLALVMMGGSASAQGGNEASLNAGTRGAALCLDLSSCNDIEFVLAGLGGGSGGSYYTLVGYEYGCGWADRGLDGSIRIDGSTAYIQYVGNITLDDFSYRLCGWNVQLDLTTNSGPVQMHCHYDGYHTADLTATLVPCPPALTAGEGPDLTQGP